MYSTFISLALIVLVYIFHSASTHPYSDRTSESLTEVNPRHGRVDNPYVVPEYDCALRAFTIEMATYIAPPSSKTNWTALSQSAFQMNECNGMSHSAYQSFSTTRPFKGAQEVKKRACHRTYSCTV
jgi:hypothetical protein